VNPNPDPVLFATLVRSQEGKLAASRLIDSLRTFGGELADSPFWVFEADPAAAPCRDLEAGKTTVLPLDVPASVKGYLFGDKVYARARAEELAPQGVGSVVWVDPFCLFVQPPRLFDLGPDYDAAVRPVHIRNVGLAPESPLDAFWQGIYAAAGLDDVTTTVESFADGRRIRSYFNSHAHAVDPRRGLFRGWFELFEKLVGDREFQSRACPDETHQIFLFQASFSALLCKAVEPGRLRILPPTYNYPYQLHREVPAERRAGSLNDMVLVTYEDCDLRPEALTDIRVDEPLRGWLSAKTNPS